MTADNTQYNIDRLINYYTSLITVNNKFADIQFGGDNSRYEDLVKRMDSIRQLILNKELANINVLYKPTLTLFNCKDHFTLLEEAIKFYRQNPNADYPISTTEFDIATDSENDLVGNNEPLGFSEQVANNADQVLATFGDKISTELCNIQELINKKFTHEDFNNAVDKLSNDTLATLTTSHEMLKSDVAKYDSLLTEHIGKSGINIVEAIEKEHIRFVQKIASDSNAIIAGITEATITELGTQTNLIATSMKQLDDKSFKRSCIVFIGAVGALFACSILSSTWAVNKLIENAKALRTASICKSVVSTTMVGKSKNY